MDTMNAHDASAAAPDGGPFDEQALRRLADQLQDDRTATAFASGYLDQLDQRVSRLRSALDAGHHDQSLDAVLSLKVSSATVGARELERLASSIETFVRRDRTAAAQRLARHLPLAATRAGDGLRHFLAASAPASR